jgi:hypothetical protein
MWNGPIFKELYSDPAEGEKEYQITASEQKDGSVQFTLYCPFDAAMSYVNSKDQPKGIRCHQCGRKFVFPLPLTGGIG